MCDFPGVRGNSKALCISQLLLHFLKRRANNVIIGNDQDSPNYLSEWLTRKAGFQKSPKRSASAFRRTFPIRLSDVKVGTKIVGFNQFAQKSLVANAFAQHNIA